MFITTEIASPAPQISETAAAVPGFETRMRVKRMMDIVLSLILLVIASPVFLLLMLMVAAGDGPVFFVHRRIGLGGREFGCFKFRTMRVDADAALARLLAEDADARCEWHATRKLKNDPRVTTAGRFLRKTSLDEVPQLLNVLRGEMSLVGPRPVVRDELDRHYVGGAAEEYLSVRPGLTGLWQVSGRSDTGYDERVALDCAYVRSLSLATDLHLLLRTVIVLLRPRGAY